MNKSLLIAIPFSMLASVSVLAESKIERFDKPTSSAPSMPEVVTESGRVRSSGHQKGQCGPVEFVTKNGKVFGLKNSDALERMHCQSEKDFEVTLVAEKQPRFLFWGGALKVRSFEVTGDLASEGHLIERSALDREVGRSQR